MDINNNSNLPTTIPQNPNNPLSPYTSIWDQPKFPDKYYAGAKLPFTPAQLKECLYNFGHSTDTPAKVCRAHSIRYETMLDLCKEYPEIDLFYKEMAKRHWLVKVDHLPDYIEKTETTIITEKGIQTNTAAVRKAELMTKHVHWRAEKTLEQYASVQRVDVRSQSINLNIDPAKLLGMNPEELSTLLQQMRKPG